MNKPTLFFLSFSFFCMANTIYANIPPLLSLKNIKILINMHRSKQLKDRGYWLLLKKEKIEQKIKNLSQKLNDIDKELGLISTNKVTSKINDKQKMIKQWLSEANPFFLHLKEQYNE